MFLKKINLVGTKDIKTLNKIKKKLKMINKKKISSNNRIYYYKIMIYDDKGMNVKMNDCL